MIIHYSNKPSSLSVSKSIQNSRETKQYRLRIWLSIGIASAILLWIAILVWHTLGLYGVLGQARQLRSSRASLLQEMPHLVQQARIHTEGIYWAMLPVLPVIDSLRWLPGWGNTLSQIEPLMLYGVALSRGADEFAAEIKPHLQSLESSESVLVWLANLAGSLNESGVSLSRSQKWFTEAALIRREIHPEWFPEKFRKLWIENESLFALAEKGMEVFPALPVLLGSDSPRRFLVLAQNNEELRATGGFISGIGKLELENGNILHFDIQDSYAIDNPDVTYPPPPEPMAYFMKAGYWMPRDANWSPDFPTAARKALELYTLSTGERMDGVIAFDQVFIVHLLEVIGPVQLPLGPEKVDSRNVMQWMVEAWAPDNGKTDEVWWGKRKEFMGLLARAIQQKLIQSEDLQTLSKVGWVILNDIPSGHFMIYLEDRNAQQVLQSAGLDAGVHLARGDFLMLVDTNMGFNKADALVERSLLYTVDLTSLENPVATLQVRYENHALPGISCTHQAEYGDTYESLRQRCYWNYWRILSPAGSRMLSSQVPVISEEQLLTGEPYTGVVTSRPGDGGWAEFSGMLLVPAASHADFVVSWQIPPSVIKSEEEGKHYTLRLQKQPGIVYLPVKIVVRFSDSVQVVPMETGWQKIEGKNEWMWQGQIDRSIELTLMFR